MSHDPNHFTKAYRASHSYQEKDISDEWKAIRNDPCGKCGHKVDDHISCPDGEPVGAYWYDCQKCKDCCEPEEVFAASKAKSAKSKVIKHNAHIVADWLESDDARTFADELQSVKRNDGVHPFFDALRKKAAKLREKKED